MSSTACNADASRCGGSTPSVRTRGRALGEHLSFAPSRTRVRFPPSPLRLRSVNGQHAPFVRPRCGFNSCRRLSLTPVAQRTERCSATAVAAGSTPAGRTTCERSSAGRAPERHSGGGPFDPRRPVAQARGVTGARRAPTSSVRVRPLAGLLHEIVAGRSGSVISWARGRRSAVRLRFPTAPHDRDERPAAGRSRNGYR